MSHNPNMGFFSVIIGSGTDTFSQVLYNANYLEAATSDTLQTKNSLSLNMCMETQVALRVASLGGQISMRKLTSTTDINRYGQQTGWQGSALVFSDDRIIDTSSSSYTLSIVITTGNGSMQTLGSSCCSIVLFNPYEFKK